MEEHNQSHLIWSLSLYLLYDLRPFFLCGSVYFSPFLPQTSIYYQEHSGASEGRVVTRVVTKVVVRQYFFYLRNYLSKASLVKWLFFWPQFILSQQPLGGYWVGYLSAYSAVIPYSYISSIMALTRQICVLLRELILNSSFLSFSLAWLTCWLPFEWRALICSDAPSNRNSNSVALEWIFFVSAVYLELKAIIYITHHRNFMASYCQKLSLQNTEYIFFHQVQFCLVFTFPPQLEL